MHSAEIKKSPLALVKRSAELISGHATEHIPANLFGIYVLYVHRKSTNKYDVQYIGTANRKNRQDIKSAIQEHKKNDTPLWTHFSTYELWDRILDEDQYHINELFKRIYKEDSKARIHISRHKKQKTDETTYIPRELFANFIKTTLQK